MVCRQFAINYAKWHQCAAAPVEGVGGGGWEGGRGLWGGGYTRRMGHNRYITVISSVELRVVFAVLQACVHYCSISQLVHGTKHPHTHTRSCISHLHIMWANMRACKILVAHYCPPMCAKGVLGLPVYLCMQFIFDGCMIFALRALGMAEGPRGEGGGATFCNDHSNAMSIQY